MLFQIKSLTVHYNKVTALRAVSMEVDEGDIVTLIGANGAGKSTTLRAVSGLVRASRGEIWFDGARIDTLPADAVVKRGIAHVPEGRRVFPELTVYENLNTGAFLRRDKEGIKQDLENVYERFPRLKERRTQYGKTLSGGEQQMLAIGRALMARPQATAARRALPRPFAGDGAGDREDHRRHQRPRRARGACRTECGTCAQARALRLCAGGPAASRWKARHSGSANDQHVRKVYLGG